MAVLARGDAPRGEALAVADAVDLVDDRHLGIAGQQEIGVQRMRRRGPRRCGTAATSAWPITWPPNTRCQPTCGERPRNRFTSSGSRSRIVEQVLDGGGHAASLADGSMSTARRPAMLRRDLQAQAPWPSLGESHAAKRADMRHRRRRLCRPRAGDRVASGAGRGASPSPSPIPRWHSQSSDPRASAIAAAARRLFEAIGVWEAVAADAQPILDMVVTDSKLDDAVRPTFSPSAARSNRASLRTHDREPAPGRCAGRQGEGTRRRPSRHGGHGFRSRRERARRHARRRRRRCDARFWSAPTARARASASRPASRRTAGTTASRRS